MEINKYIKEGFLIIRNEKYTHLKKEIERFIHRKKKIAVNEWVVILFGGKGSAFVLAEDDKIIVIETGKIINKSRLPTYVNIAKYDGLNIIIEIEKRKSICIYRDRLGINEIFYNKEHSFFTNNIHLALYIQKEIEINPRKILEYLAYRYTSGEETLYRDIKVVKPGHYIDIRDSNVKAKKYYKIEFRAEDREYEYWKNKTVKCLKDNLRKLDLGSNDSKIGMFLSSGVDSNILYWLQEWDDIRTITGDFREKGYEEAKVNKTWKAKPNKGLYIKTINYNEFDNNIPKTIEQYGMPLNAPNMVSYSILFKYAKNLGILWLINGEGADALFGGTSIYRMAVLFHIPKWIRYFLANGIEYVPEKINQKMFYGKKEKLIGILNKDFYDVVLSMHAYSDIFEVSNLILNYSENMLDRKNILDSLGSKLTLELINKFQITVVMAEEPKFMSRLGRANNVELYFPYLEGKMIELIEKMPMKYKYRKRTLKYILKDICKDFMPAELVYARKSGFGVPLEKWMYEKEWYEDIIENIFDQQHDEFDPKQMAALKEKFIRKEIKDYDYEGLIWTLYNYCRWKTEFIKQDLNE